MDDDASLDALVSGRALPDEIRHKREMADREYEAIASVLQPLIDGHFEGSKHPFIDSTVPYKRMASVRRA